MSPVIQGRTADKQSFKSSAALALVLSVLLSALISGIFILSHTGHTHDNDGAGGSCTVCLQIQNAENLLKPLKAAVNNISLTHYLFLVAALISCRGFFPSAFGTPVKLKSRIND